MKIILILIIFTNITFAQKVINNLNDTTLSKKIKIYARKYKKRINYIDTSFNIVEGNKVNKILKENLIQCDIKCNFYDKIENEDYKYCKIIINHENIELKDSLILKENNRKIPKLIASLKNFNLTVFDININCEYMNPSNKKENIKNNTILKYNYDKLKD